MREQQSILGKRYRFRSEPFSVMGLQQYLGIIGAAGSPGGDPEYGDLSTGQFFTVSADIQPGIGVRVILGHVFDDVLGLLLVERGDRNRAVGVICSDRTGGVPNTSIEVIRILL